MVEKQGGCVFLLFTVYERWAFKNAFITYASYAPDVLFWTVLYAYI